MKKLLSTITILLFSLAMASCGVKRIGEEEKTDIGKTQLFIGNFDGGYGEEWINKAKARFEEKYKDHSFEEGKKGVQVLVRSSKNYVGVNLQTEISGLQQDIFFTESVYYYDFVNQGLLLDITDVVEKPLNHEFIEGTTNTSTETTSIEGKMRQGHTNFLKTPENKYYGLPFYEANYNLIYDVDLFEDELLYFAAPGLGNSFGFITDLSMPRSAGPDGDFTTTYDNGLPATYDDFFKLADYMVRKNIVPVTWAGNVQNYVSSLLTAFWADFEGVDQMMLNYTFDGTATNLVERFDENGKPVLSSQVITEDNGYLTYAKQAGRFHALSFLERLLGNRTYYNSALTFSPAQTHRDAQDSFLSGKYISNNDTIGMLIDGTWWQHEAGNVFDAMVKAYGQDASSRNRKFAIMPLPKVNNDHLGQYTVYEANFSMAFINANVEPWKQPLAKAFLQFVHTNDSLVEFTKTTNTFRPFEYDMNETDLASLTHWGRSLYDVHVNAAFVTPYAYNAVYLKNISTYANELDIWNSLVGGNSLYNIPTNAMFNNDVTARRYFEGMSNHWTKSYWDSRRG
jgi:uncharacterized protein YxeA